jgi:hypothetical protein
MFLFFKKPFPMCSDALKNKKVTTAGFSSDKTSEASQNFDQIKNFYQKIKISPKNQHK